MYENIKEQIKEYKKQGLKIGEENTKQTLVLPLLYTLGYNIFDPKELQLEYVSDMRDNGGERVDYAIMQDGVPIIFVEVKAMGTKLKPYIGQLRRYYTANKEVKYGILTDGQHYQFYVDSTWKNLMDEEPFYELDIETLEGVDREFLDLFRRENLERVDSERQSFTLRHFLRNNVENPSESYLEYISNGVGYTVVQGQLEKAQKENKKKNTSIVKEQKEYTPKHKTAEKKGSPKTYTVLGMEYEFSTWRDIVYTTLNRVLEKEGTLEKIKREVPNRVTYGINKRRVSKYTTEELDNGEYVHIQLGSKDIQRVVKLILEAHEPGAILELGY